MSRKSAINWFEIPVNDFDRAKKFYETLFEFTMKEQIWANTRIGYFEWSREEDGRGGSIVYDPEFYTPSTHGPLIYLNCEPKIQKVIDKVIPAGGKVLQNKTIVAARFDLGYWALILDTEGNRIALHALE